MNPLSAFAAPSSPQNKKRPASERWIVEGPSPAKSRSRNLEDDAARLVTPEKKIGYRLPAVATKCKTEEEEPPDTEVRDQKIVAAAALEEAKMTPKVAAKGKISSFFLPKKRSGATSSDSPGKSDSKPLDCDLGPQSQSFGAVTAESFPSLKGKNIKAHTLILGTHPSVASLDKSEYYGHPMNAFWWIVGDCLGFRRLSGKSKASGRSLPYSEHLRYENVISYEDQLETMCAHGFCIWDIVKSCQRQGSLDSDIKEDTPNEIQKFCDSNPSIRRIALTGGVGGFKLLKKHFPKWFKSSELALGADIQSQRMAKTWPLGNMNGKFVGQKSKPRITIVVPPAVSPAAQQQTYFEKRESWEANVFRPGLQDHIATNEIQTP